MISLEIFCQQTPTSNSFDWLNWDSYVMCSFTTLFNDYDHSVVGCNMRLLCEGRPLS